MNKSLATLRRLTKKEFEELPLEKLLEIDGLVPLSKACTRFELNAKQIRNAARSLSKEEQLEQLGLVTIRPENSAYSKVFLVLDKLKEVLARFKPEKPEVLSLSDHDFLAEPEPPEGWYKLRDILHHYPLIQMGLDELEQSKWYREDHDLVHLPGALSLFKK